MSAAGHSAGGSHLRLRDPALEQIRSRPPLGRVDLPVSWVMNPDSSYTYFNNFPPKPPHPNPHGTQVDIELNQFQIKEWTNASIFQYDIHYSCLAGGEIKRGTIKAIWESQTLQDWRKVNGRFWLWDGNKLAWCRDKTKTQISRLTVNLHKRKPMTAEEKKAYDKKSGDEKKQIENEDQKKISKNTFKVQITGTVVINMNLLTSYLNRQSSWDEKILPAINFLDHCLRQTPSEKFLALKRSYYDRTKPTKTPLDTVVEAVKGVYFSVRLCEVGGSSGDYTGLAVNVDVANGAFWITGYCPTIMKNLVAPDQTVDKLKDILMPVAVPGAKGQWNMTPQFQDLRRMSGLQFTCSHMKAAEGQQREIHSIKGFVWDRNLCFDGGGHSKNVKFEIQAATKSTPAVRISVYEYFKRKYNIQLQYWYLPVIVDRRGNFYPPEVCEIPGNQRFTFKLGSEQTQKMVKFCATRPNIRMQTIASGVEMFNWSQDPVLKHYGIKIDSKPTKSKGLLLANPEVHFGGTGSKPIDPGHSGKWDIRNRKFWIKNSTPLKNWAVVQLGARVKREVVETWVETFIKTYSGHGGVILNKKPYIHIQDTKMKIDELVDKVRAKVGGISCDFMFFILPDKNSFTYESLKKSLECRWGLMSQMLQSVQIPKNNMQYCSNVSMKVNAKLGGTTSKAIPKYKTVKRDGKLVTECSHPWYPQFQSKRIVVIGADVSHPSPGSPQGSMAALTMSMDKDMLRYAAGVQTNGYRQEIITKENIKALLVPMMQKWAGEVSNGAPPDYVFYFRDGVSEGQYQAVLQEEVMWMRYAIRDYVNPKWPKMPWTVIICSKRHHLRFFPASDKKLTHGDANGNPKPGTLIERDITHPFEYDFYMTTHSAIQGTARPVHYHVILDEAKIPNFWLQQFINDSCYQYMRSTTPVGQFPAVYYAHIASNRARGHENVNDDEGPRGGKEGMDARWEEKQRMIIKINSAQDGPRPPQSTAGSQSGEKKQKSKEELQFLGKIVFDDTRNVPPLSDFGDLLPGTCGAEQGMKIISRCKWGMWWI